MEQKKTNKMGSRMNANLPALILVAVLLFTWQAAAMGIGCSLYSPVSGSGGCTAVGTSGSIIYGTSAGDDVGSCDWTFDLDRAGRGTGCADGCQ